MRIRLIALFVTAFVLFGIFVSRQIVCCAEAAQATGASVTGSVVDGQLTPIRGVLVVVERDGRVVSRATTDDNGLFRFDRLAPGVYVVRATRDGYPALERELRVSTGVSSLQLPLVLVRPEDDVRAVAQPPASMTANSAAVPAETSRQMERVGRGSASQRPDVVGGIAPPPVSSPMPAPGVYPPGPRFEPLPPASREGYAHVRPNRFHRTIDEPLSTFAADVDTASFANVRRFLRNGQLPPADAVRVEEFVNYFRFDYAAPRDGHPIGVTTEIADAPWEPRHKLVLIGARSVAPRKVEPGARNIVLLIDVSGSMASADKLPLLKSALGMFVDTLDPDDRIAVVTYAGSSGVVLAPTPARDRRRILSAIADLGAGGSTNGAQGLITAYRIARQAFVPGGINRVMLATDGDFNVGVTSRDGLLRLIEREKASGVFLSVLGVGTGNLQDATMELLADKGNGHYAYLDSLQEARRVLVREAGSTLETVAKDVKFQVEFNPAEVAAWKLVGYENRLLAHEDFNDDSVDGGEMGAGHTVTVLYEIVPAGSSSSLDGDDDGSVRPAIDPLRYQPRETVEAARPAKPAQRGEWLTVKVRYQEPEGDTSRLVTHPLRTASVSQPVHLPFAAAVAEYGLLLRDERPNQARWDALVRSLERLTVPSSRAADKDALLEMVTLARALKRLD